MTARDAWELIKGTAQDFNNDNCSQQAAALSYATVFSLPPLLILLVIIAGLVWKPQDIQGAIVTQITSLIGPQGAQQVRDMLRLAHRPGGGSVIASVIGFIALIAGATGAFIQLQSALNTAWEVQPDPAQGGIKNFIMRRILSFGMILGIAFLLLVSLALTTALSALGSYVGSGLPEVLLQVLTFVVSFVVITLLFAAMFKVLPDAEIAWHDVWVGGIGTALLFVIGKFLLGFYLGRSNPGSAFGAAGSLALILVWIYYASMILLFGAEFTRAWAQKRGREIRPKPGAVRTIRPTQRVRDGDAAHPRVETEEQHPSTSREAPTARRASATPRGGSAASTSTATKNENPEAKAEGRGNPTTIEAVRHDMEVTRERMSQTIEGLSAELGARRMAVKERVSDTVDGVKDHLDVARLIREHPWTALSAALGVGVALAASGADEKAARAATAAAVDTARRAARATTEAAHHAVDAVTDAATGVVERVRGGAEESTSDSVDEVSPDVAARGGLLQRVTDALRAAVQEEVTRLLRDIGATEG